MTLRRSTDTAARAWREGQEPYSACRKCRHSREDRTGLTCRHPDNAALRIIAVHVSVARSHAGACGPEAQYWESSDA